MVVKDINYLKEEATKKVELEFIHNIHSKVKASPNVDIAKAILVRADRNRGCFFQDLQVSLKANEEELNKTVEYLTDSGIIYVENHGRLSRDGEEDSLEATIDEGIKKYLASDLPFGSYRIISKVGLEKSVVLEALNSVKDMSEFKYSKTFRPDIEYIKNSKSRFHNLLKPIRQAEKELWHNELGIPKQFRGFPSFVSEKDPTKSFEGYPISSFTLSGDFSSPKEALEADVDTIYTYPLTSQPIKSSSGAINSLPCVIEIHKRKDSYDFVFEDACLPTHISNNWSLFHRKEAREKMVILKEKLNKIFD